MSESRRKSVAVAGQVKEKGPVPFPAPERFYGSGRKGSDETHCAGVRARAVKAPSGGRRSALFSRSAALGVRKSEIQRGLQRWGVFYTLTPPAPVPHHFCACPLTLLSRRGERSVAILWRRCGCLLLQRSIPSPAGPPGSLSVRKESRRRVE
ncbi:unnamed protein product [Rangifer tarandus platyrhynchus]|uniref:Uncharacterized protein n=1 Tax=Rangifer tarandus platyrhynchus TaxID=3082113 RepID=A0AC59YA20_RANTA